MQDRQCSRDLPLLSLALKVLQKSFGMANLRLLIAMEAKRRCSWYGSESEPGGSPAHGISAARMFLHWSGAVERWPLFALLLLRRCAGHCRGLEGVLACGSSDA